MIEHCYACGVTIDPGLSPTSRMNIQFSRYERVVEWIEDQHRLGPFSIMSLWRELGGGPPMLTVVRYVIRDLARHGLTRCAHQTRNRCCLQWELIH
jgi:hypothetical protein